MITIKHLVTKKEISTFLSSISTQDPVSRLILTQAGQILDQEKFVHNHFYSTQALMDFIWEKLNTGHWSAVDTVWRKLFSVISIMKVLIVIELGGEETVYDNLILKDLVKMCDIGLLMGAPVLDNVCSKLASFFCQKVQMIKDDSKINRKYPYPYFFNILSQISPLKLRSQGTSALPAL